MPELTAFVFQGNLKGNVPLETMQTNVKHPENEFSVGCFFDHE